jgi:DNA-binding beta-propeller fold protein YncE
MKKAIAGISMVLLAGTLAACNPEQVKSPAKNVPAVQKEITGFSAPESVMLHSSGVYVSNIGAKLDPTGKDGDGFISKLNAQGKILELKYLPKTGVLNAPKGMAIIGSVLYVADVDRVVGFDLASRATVFEVTVSGTSFLNDCTVKDAHTLLVSSTDSNRIVEVDVTAKTVTEVSVQGTLTGPNGLWFDAATQNLYVVGMGTNNQPNGEVGVINFADKLRYTALSDKRGMLDGLARLNDGTLLFSNWVEFGPKGVLYQLDAKTKALTTLNLPLLAGPADFAYDAAANTLWIPELLANKIQVVTLPE